MSKTTDSVFEESPSRGLKTKECREASIAMADHIIQNNEDVKDVQPMPDVTPESVFEASPRRGLTTEEYREASVALIDYIIQNNEDIKDVQPMPDVTPGFMRNLVPQEAPEGREKWQDVFKDIVDVTKNVLQWHSSNMFGFFPAANSYPAMLGDVLSTAIADIGFTWESSPSCTELETVVMDWLAKAIDLPKFYLNEGNGKGGGVIQATASEATLMSLLSARSRTVRKQLALNPDQSTCEIVNRLVAYTSSYSHSSVERASQVSLVHMRFLEVDELGAVRGETLLEAIKEDKARGKIPIYFCATLGTTSCCTYDNLKEIGPICKDENLWLHVDAAYAGSALLCPEMRYIAEGIEYSDSYNFNPHKLMMVNFDCSAFWVKNSVELTNVFDVNPHYLRHDNQNIAIDYMNWELPVGRRFRAIKLWFVMRMVGLEGLRTHVRRSIAEAKYFEALVEKDQRFEVLYPVTMGLVCFRLFNKDLSKKELNDMNERLYEEVMADKTIFLTSTVEKGIYFLRVSAGHVNTTREGLSSCWKIIQSLADRVGK